MAGEARALANGAERIDFQTDPSRYRQWKLAVDGEIATLKMDVDENGGLFEGYQLKLNSYDLGVDIELADAIQRLRFEHPDVKVVILRSGKERVFCAGANIRMLAGATHAHKVNFCKFTNETRNGMEDSSENSGQRFICVVNGAAAGGGYELALAADHIILADDGSSSVALPEVPLLAVLPGTGGLTRVVDKRKVRRDDAILHLRINELEIAALVFKTIGESAKVLSYDSFLHAHRDHWLANEILHYWKRVLKRIDVTSRTLVALVEPGSCFAGTLAELVLAADRSYMLVGEKEGDNRGPATMVLHELNFSAYPMSHGLTRLQQRLIADPSELDHAREKIGAPLEGDDAEGLGLVTFALDDIDWEDEIRVFLEGRASFSPDSLTGMEANLRFVGPETMESKIFSLLTAWQNWIFQRPNAVGEEGALRRYGSGQKPRFDMTRV